MEIWLDAQLSPVLAPWIQDTFGVPCIPVRDITLQSSADLKIFNMAKAKGSTVILTKDADFCQLLNTLGAPPKIIWLTIGNRSNTAMKDVFLKKLPMAISLLATNDLIEISE